jgi:zinc transport system substrate-binding protein
VRTVRRANPFAFGVTLLSAATLLLALPARAADSPVRVVTSIPPLAMLVSELGGDRVTVHSILPPGADPHTFEPRPSDARAVAEASLVVMLGSAIDEWLAGTLAVSPSVAVVRLDEAHREHDDHAHASHDHADDDLHVWLDPAWVRERAVPSIQRALVAADPAGAAGYGASARTMSERLIELEEDVRAEFEGAATRSFFAWHPAWHLFAKRFGLHPVANLGEAEGREPSLRAMIGAARAARAAGVRAILVEPQVDRRQAAVIADELALPLLTVDPLGDAWSLDRSTYRLLMMFNAHAFAQALGVERDDDDEKDTVSVPPPS